jgi:hypothetical protein
MTRRNPPVSRTAALVALGALVVHQLRYLGTYGADAGAQLTAQGHGYLGDVTPLVIAVSLAAVAACLVRAALGEPSQRRRGPTAATAVFAVAIFGTFAAQEALEGMLFAGHLHGVAAVFGQGGWLAVPLALALAAICVLVETVLGRLESALAVLVSPRSERRRPAVTAAAPRAVLLRRISPLALGTARRPPPLAA